jgi:hypothetical protein
MQGMQRMRDAIVSDINCVCVLRVPKKLVASVGLVLTYRILRFELMLLKLFYKHFDQNKTQY